MADVSRHEWTGVAGCRYAVDKEDMWILYTPAEGEPHWLKMHRTNGHGIEILRLAAEVERLRADNLRHVVRASEMEGTLLALRDLHETRPVPEPAKVLAVIARVLPEPPDEVCG